MLQLLKAHVLEPMTREVTTREMTREVTRGRSPNTATRESPLLTQLEKVHAWQQKSAAAAAAAKSLQSCPTLCDPIDGSPPGSPVLGILRARTLGWVAISFSNAGKWKVKVKTLSHVRFLVTPWTGAYQAPPSMGFSRQQYWSGVPLPSPNKKLVQSKMNKLIKLKKKKTSW